MNIRTKISLGEPHPHMGPLISSYQDGLTDPAETETVERHLLECELCRAFFGGLQQAREAVRDLPDPEDSLGHTEVQFRAILNRTVYSNKPKPKKAGPPAERGLKKLISQRKRAKKKQAPVITEPNDKTPETAKKRARSSSR